jgi:flavodoxin
MQLFEKEESVRDKKSLVIYFSRAGENYSVGNIKKGNTQVIAEYISEITGATLFKVETLKGYSQNYKTCCDEALKEKNENARPQLNKYLDNIDEFEVIYIGYPNWWGTMPMAMFTQLEKLQFTGKIIKPFCTHEGSGLGSSERDIKSVCVGGKVMSGLAIQGSTVHNAKEKVANWIK